jgi:hypothetical protein
MRLITLIILACTLGCSGKTENAVSSPGEDGAAGEGGEEGAPGEDGEDGADGLPCWDLNGDGEPNPEEDTNGDGVVDIEDCRGDGAGGDDTGDAPDESVRAYIGDVYFNYEVEAAYFCEHYDRIYGRLTVNDYDGEDLSALSCLKEVTQTVHLYADIPSVSLPNLERVGQQLYISGASTEEAIYDNLENIGSLQLHIGSESSSIVIASFPSLTDILDEEGLTLGSSGIQEPDFPVLSSVAGLVQIGGNYSLLNLDGFAALRTVAGHLTIGGNETLLDITGLMGVTSVGQWLTISGNEALPTSQAETLAATIPDIGGAISISDNGPG